MLYMVWSAESNKWNGFLLLISPDNAMLKIRYFLCCKTIGPSQHFKMFNPFSKYNNSSHMGNYGLHLKKVFFHI